jgi:hypothetical protein
MQLTRRHEDTKRADAEGANRPGPDSVVSMMAHRGGGGFPARAILTGLTGFTKLAANGKGASSLCIGKYSCKIREGLTRITRIFVNYWGGPTGRKDRSTELRSESGYLSPLAFVCAGLGIKPIRLSQLDRMGRANGYCYGLTPFRAQYFLPEITWPSGSY